MASRGADAVLRHLEAAVRRRAPAALLAAFSESCLQRCPGFTFRPRTTVGALQVLDWKHRSRPGTLADDLWGQLTLFASVHRVSIHFEAVRFAAPNEVLARVAYAVDGALQGGAVRADRATFALRLRRQADGAWQVTGFAIASGTTVVRAQGRLWTVSRVAAHPPGPGPADLAAPGADLGPDLAVADVDGDGRLDVFLPGAGLGRLLVNRGGGKLVPGPELRDIPGGAVGHRARFADVDGDGDPDLLVASRVGPSLLLVNEGGRFRRARRRGLEGLGTAASVAWIDVDGDGRLDLVLGGLGRGAGQAGPAPALLWLRNEADGFRRHPIRPIRGPVGAMAPVALCTADLDGDGRVDLVAVPALGRVTLLRNLRGRGFAPAVRTAHPALGRACTVIDLDGDGDLDVLVAAVHSAEAWKLDLPSLPLPVGLLGQARRALAARLARLGRGSFWLRNEGGWHFSEQPLAQPASLGWDLAVAAEDLDGDGRPEIALAGGFHAPAPRGPARARGPRPGARPLDPHYFTVLLPRRLARRRVSPLPLGGRPLGATRGATLLRHHRGRALDLGAALGLRVPSGVRGAAWADLDRDGRPELLLRLRSGALLVGRLHAPLGAGRTLTVRLWGSGAPVTGARLQAWGLAHQATAQLDGGAADRPWAEARLGLGDAVRADRIEITWPSGRRQTIQDLETDARYRIARDGTLSREASPASGATVPPGAQPHPTPPRRLFPGRRSRDSVPAARPPGAGPSALAALGLSGLLGWRLVPVSAGRRGPDTSSRGALPPKRLVALRGARATVLYLPPLRCPGCPRYLDRLDRAAVRWQSRGVRVIVVLPLPELRRNSPARPWLARVLRRRPRAALLVRRAPDHRPQPPTSAGPAAAGRLLVLGATGRPQVCFVGRQAPPLLLEHFFGTPDP